jgi:hypothetical protein
MTHKQGKHAVVYVDNRKLKGKPEAKPSVPQQGETRGADRGSRRRCLR